MIKKINIIIAILIIYFQISINAQVTPNICQTNLKRILEIYEKEKIVFLTNLKDSLKSALVKDSIIPKYISTLEDFDFNRLSIIIVPSLYLTGDEDEYTNKINICDLLEIDTINFEYHAYIYNNKELYIYCGYEGGCGCGVPGEKFGFHKPHFFSQYFINDELKLKNKVSYDFYKNFFGSSLDFLVMIRGGFGEVNFVQINHIFYTFFEVNNKNLKKIVAESYFSTYQTFPEWQNKLIIKYCKPEKMNPKKWWQFWK